jgi:hypothetical protein
MKPAARAQGKGIFLFRKLQDITQWRRVKKFDYLLRFIIQLFYPGRIYDSL